MSFVHCFLVLIVLLGNTIVGPFHLLFPSLLVLYILEDTARYAGLLLAPAEGFGLRSRPFLPFGQKTGFFISVLAQILVIFGDQ